jgi:hypothetical protein
LKINDLSIDFQGLFCVYWQTLGFLIIAKLGHFGVFNH